MKDDGVIKRRVFLPFGFAVGIGPLTYGKVPWYDLQWIAWFSRRDLKCGEYRVWHIRLLWFYFGRRVPLS